MLRRTLAAMGAIALATALTTAIVVSPAAGVAENGDIVAALIPPGSSISPVGHYYLLDAKPGATITQQIRIVNTNKHPVSAQIEPVDAATSDATGAVYGTPGSPKATTSRWIVVATPQLTLQPQEGRDVSFTVRVPTHAKAGQYLAAISASVPLNDVSKKQAPQGGAAFQVGLQPQRIIAVEVDVPGARAPRLVVSDVVPTATPNGIALGVHISNEGNAFAHGQGVISVADTNTDYSFRIDTFVSQTSIVYPMQWTRQVVAGLHHVQVDLTYEGGRRTSWSGTVNIAGDLQNQLENSLRSVRVHPHRSSVLWLVLLGLLLLGLIGGAIRMRRRSRRPSYVKYRAA